MINKYKYLIAICLLLVAGGCDNLFFEEDATTEDDALAVYDAFYEEVDQYFSFFAYLSADFDSAYAVNREKLEENPSQDMLIISLGELLQVLQDGHTNVFLNNNSSISYTGWYDQYPINVLPDLSSYFSSYTDLNRALGFGELENSNIGYISIKTFTGKIAISNYAAIDDILNSFSDKEAIVIDVRSNGGGSSNNADLITSRFNDESRLAFRSRRKLAGARDSFGPWSDIYTEVYDGYRFLKPVVVLTNRRSYSATEWFVSNMRTIPHVTVIGDTTGGGSGNPLPLILPNGWTMRVSNSQKQLPDGHDYQYKGIYPDVPIWISEADSVNGIDTILEEAMDQLSITN